MDTNMEVARLVAGCGLRIEDRVAAVKQLAERIAELEVARDERALAAKACSKSMSEAQERADEEIRLREEMQHERDNAMIENVKLRERIAELEAEVADLLPDAQRGNTWIYKRGPEYLMWLKRIAEITNTTQEGFYSGQRVLNRVEELAADRDGLLALVQELSARLR